MIVKFKDYKGCIYYEIPANNLNTLMKARVFGPVCDDCNSMLKTAYYVPVLHELLCARCLDEFLRRYKPLAEDKSFEIKRAESIERLIKLYRIKMKQDTSCLL